MRIAKLRLENFRIHADSVLDFGASSFVVIRGRNFAGKSTIGQALSMCMTPSTRGLDPQGRGFNSKIKRGAAKAVIAADIQTKHHLVQRTVTLNSNLSGRTHSTICLSDPQWNPAQFDRHLETHRGALAVVLNTDAFLSMDEKEQKNLLAALALPARYDFERRMVEAVDKALGPGEVRWEGEPFAVINQAYKKLFEERQIVNRQVRDFHVPESLPLPGGEDSKALQALLTALREERQRRQEKRDKAVSEANKGEVIRARARGKLQVMEEGLASVGEKLEALGRDLLPDDRLAYLTKVASGAEELARLRKEKLEVEQVLDEDMKRLARLEEIPEAGTTCPTCDQVIDGKKLEALGAKLAAQVHEAKDRNQMLHQKIKAMGEVDEAVALIAKHKAAVAGQAEIDAKTTDTQRRIEEGLQQLPKAEPFDFAPYDRSIAECDAEIEKVNANLRPVIAAEERAKEIAIRSEQLAGLKTRAALLDQLVKYFDKDGIKAKLLGEYIGGFEAKLNEVLSAWGYACALSIEPYSFDVTNARGDTNPVRELSGAEEVMFSLAFQCAVSRTANIGLVVIDEVAMFLPELRPTLNRRLFEMIRNGYLEQVVLLVADSSEEVPRLPGTAFFMVDDGRVYPLRNGAQHAVQAG